MGKTSVAVKEKYNSKAYDDVRLRVAKGDREKIKAHAESLGMSLNGYIVALIEKDMGGGF